MAVKMTQLDDEYFVSYTVCEKKDHPLFRVEHMTLPRSAEESFCEILPRVLSLQNGETVMMEPAEKDAAALRDLLGKVYVKHEASATYTGNVRRERKGQCTLDLDALSSHPLYASRCHFTLKEAFDTALEWARKDRIEETVSVLEVVKAFFKLHGMSFESQDALTDFHKIVQEREMDGESCDQFYMDSVQCLPAIPIAEKHSIERDIDLFGEESSRKVFSASASESISHILALTKEHVADLGLDFVRMRRETTGPLEALELTATYRYGAYPICRIYRFKEPGFLWKKTRFMFVSQSIE